MVGNDLHSIIETSIIKLRCTHKPLRLFLTSLLLIASNRILHQIVVILRRQNITFICRTQQIEVFLLSTVHVVVFESHVFLVC